jgi:uncharacterized protein HemX
MATTVMVPSLSPHKKKKNGILLAVFLVLIVGLAATVYIVSTGQTTNIQNRATFTQPNSCPVEGATCSWDAAQGATSYRYNVIDKATGASVKSGTTTANSITFTAVAGFNVTLLL